MHRAALDALASTQGKVVDYWLEHHTGILLIDSQLFECPEMTCTKQ